jgi:hypothetical protein
MLANRRAETRDLPDARAGADDYGRPVESGESSSKRRAAAARADLVVRVDLGERELAGQLIAPRQPARAFHGWLDLLTALDQALDALTYATAETGGTRVHEQPGVDEAGRSQMSTTCMRLDRGR